MGDREDDHLQLWLQNARFIVFPLLRYPNVIKTQAEKMSMDGENILEACRMLQIEYSKYAPAYNQPGPSESNLSAAGSNGSDVINQPIHMTSALQTGVSVDLNEALGTTSVLFVQNVNENLTKCDDLFTLFGVYGDVQRVKIMFNKKSSALVQMSEPQQAILAKNHLNKIKLWGKAIRVIPSKHTTVQLPKDGQPDAGLTKDYGNSNLHRFKIPGSKNYSHIYPPSSMLHLPNIPTSIKEHDLPQVFYYIGLQVQAFEFFPKDRKMALVQLVTVDDAIKALVKLHNYPLSETSHLRVSFSKPSISRREENETEYLNVNRSYQTKHKYVLDAAP